MAALEGALLISAESEPAVIVPPSPSMAPADRMTAEPEALIAPPAMIDETGLGRALTSCAPFMPPASRLTIAWPVKGLAGSGATNGLIAPVTDDPDWMTISSPVRNWMRLSDRMLAPVRTIRLPPASTLILPAELTAPVIVAPKLLLKVVGTPNAPRPATMLMAG